MYGFDGNITALEWACAYGFGTVTKEDQVQLISKGLFSTDGVFQSHKVSLEELSKLNKLVTTLQGGVAIP